MVNLQKQVVHDVVIIMAAFIRQMTGTEDDHCVKPITVVT